MDDQQQTAPAQDPNGSMNQAAPMGQSADPMAAPMPPTPPMPSQDMTGMASATPADPTAPASGMEGMAGMTPPPPPPPPAATSDPMAAAGMSAPAATGPATMDDLMAELRKIEDKLVEMDEKL